MAVCVGCGLTINVGILEVQVCPQPDPAPEPNSQGGLVCDPATAGANGDTGCLKVVLNDTHAGCGLNASGGALEVDPCLNGGILCGATDDDPEDNCIYVNVQGQGAGPCVDLATAQGNCPNTSPNCNGMVRTCDGLWAPPKLFGTAFAARDQDEAPDGTSIEDYTIDPGNVPDVPGSLGDGFPGPGNDLIVTNNPTYETLYHDIFFPESCNTYRYGNTFSTFSVSYNVEAGELWRWLLWERIGVPAVLGGPATVAGSSILGTPWALQASFYIDRRGRAAGIETVQMNDVSTIIAGGGAGNTRMEYMITVQRLIPNAGALNNTIVGIGTRQYRATINNSHCEFQMVTSNAVVPGPPVSFP